MTAGPRQERLWDRAERYLAQRNPEAARATLEALVASEPGHVMARLRLSTLATAAGRYRDSLDHLLAVARSRPVEPELALMLAGMLHRLGEVAVAVSLLSDPGVAAAADRDTLEQMAQIANQMEAADLAVRLLGHADALGTPTVASRYLRATLQTFAGDIGSAEATLEDCIARAPAHAPAHWSLARLRKQHVGSNHVARLRQQLELAAEPASEAWLAFALFKELDDLGDSDGAWQALQRGCAAKRRLLAYSPAEEEAAFARLHAIRATDGDALASGSGADGALAAASAPIFIVGLPRTGTTLLERILGGSGEVENAGELDELPLQLRWQANRFSKTFLDPAVFDAAARANPAELGARYLGHASWRARGKPRFTDKLPPNFLHVGFIVPALPQARILHLVREPMDTCFSNLKELFADAYPYSYDLDELAAHYGRYRRLMAHWHAQFPGRVLDVSYERLVAEPLVAAREVFDFCGLAWDPACVDIARGGGAVSTASTVQVREGIHSRRVGGWRPYARQLEPLRARLQRDGWLPA